MGTIYLLQHGLYLHKDGGHFVIEKDDNPLSEVSIEKVDGIVAMNTTHISSAVIAECFKEGIPISWMSTKGHLYGTLLNLANVDVQKHYKQFQLLNDPEKLYHKLAAKMIAAKIHNQGTLLRRYNRDIGNDKIRANVEQIFHYVEKVEICSNREVFLGYEGLCSRLYFEGLGVIVPPPFTFTARSKQPPRDPINAILSLGYTLLFNEILIGLLQTGLHPFIGFLHKIRNNHPALVSDLIEEWRVPIIDSMVLAAVRRNMIQEDMFTNSEEGCYVNHEGSKLLINLYNDKLKSEQTYLGSASSYREAIRNHCRDLSRALVNNDVSQLAPIRIR